MRALASHRPAPQEALAALSLTEMDARLRRTGYRRANLRLSRRADGGWIVRCRWTKTTRAGVSMVAITDHIPAGR